MKHCDIQIETCYRDSFGVITLFNYAILCYYFMLK